MKQEQSNTFTEGLIQDLNPINTPETVLTDNLNGTIITYDGNEYSLQNDRGNYALKYCRLKPNYIPVGVKEYADTLYIVSHNPLDGSTEIGSYPSPLEVTSSDDDGDSVNIASLVQQSDKYPNFTDLVQQAQMHVFSDDNLKLYPGDEYQINLKDESKYIYEELEYYIIDENRNKYNITKHIKENSDFVPTGWTIPGWMAVQYRLAAFEDFQMNIRSFSVPTLAYNSNGIINLNFQLKISDEILLKRLSDSKHLDEIGLSIYIKKNNKTSLYLNNILFSDINGGFVEWYEDSRILWAQKEINLSGLNQGDVVSIVATPFISINVDDKTYKIVYDNFAENLDVSLTTAGSYDDFKLANNIWKFWLEDDDKNNLYLEFDISGPVVTSNTINLYYKISEIPDKSTKYAKSTEYIKLESYNGIGQNMILIPFDYDIFKPEGMYIIEFVFAEKNPNTFTMDKYNSKSFKKLIIASQIFSSFVKDVPNFESITFDSWISKYSSTIKNADKWNIVVDSNNQFVSEYRKGEITESGITDVNIPEHLKDFWTTSESKSLYDHTAFIDENEWDETVGEHTEFLRGYKTSADISLSTELEILNGPLWNGMNRNIIIKILSHDTLLSSNSYSVDNIYNVFNTTINPIIASKCTVTYDKESEGIVKGSNSRNNTSKSIKNDGIKYAIVVGSNKRSGGNNYIITFLNGVNQDLPYKGSSIPTNTNEVKEIGTKSKIPNTLSGSIASFMAYNNLPFIVVFVVARTINDKRGVAVISGESQLFNANGQDITMQPFIVFLNKQKNPIFFPIDGWGPSSFPGCNSEENFKHDIPFDNWGLESFTRHINSMIGDFVQYKISDISDGYFIKCNYQNDFNSTLNITTEINIPEISKWYIQNYDLLNSNDRALLKNTLQDITFGNLLSGSVTKLEQMSIHGLEYNREIETTDAIKDMLSKLNLQIDKINDQAILQWKNWITDSVYKEVGYSEEISGLTMTNSGSSNTDKFKQSELYSLIRNSSNGSELTLSVSGERLLYDVTGGNDNGPYCIGYIHPSITFP